MFYTTPRLTSDSWYKDPSSDLGDEANWLEVAESAADSLLKSNSLLSGHWNLDKTYDDHIAKVKEITGKELRNPTSLTYGVYESDDERRRFNADLAKYREDGGSLSDWGYSKQWREQEFRRQLGELAAAHPDKTSELLPDMSFLEQSYGVARKAQDREHAVWDRSDKGIGAWSASLAGALWGSAQDPVNWITAPIGFSGVGTGAKGLAMGFLKAGTANAAVEAAVQPFVQSYRSEAGLDSGAEQAATAIGGAFLFGGALDTTVRGIARGLRYSFGYEPIIVNGVVRGYRKRGAAPAIADGAAPSAPGQAEPPPAVDIPAELLARAEKNDRAAIEEIDRIIRGGDDTVITQRTVDQADAGDPKAIREIAEKTGVAGDPIARQSLDAMDANEMLRVKPSDRVPDVDHDAAIAQGLRHASDPEIEPPPVVRDGATPQAMSDIRNMVDDLRAEIKRLEDDVASRPDAKPPADMPDLRIKLAEAESSYRQMRRAIYDDGVIERVDAGDIPPDVADLVAAHVPDKAAQGRAIDDLMARNPGSAREARQMLSEMLASPDYRPDPVDTSPPPAGLKTKALDDPYGKEAAQQVDALKQKMSDELGIGKTQPTPEQQAAEIKAIVDRGDEVRKAIEDMAGLIPEGVPVKTFTALSDLPDSIRAEVEASNALLFADAVIRFQTARSTAERDAARRFLDMAKAGRGVEGIARGGTIWIATYAMNPRGSVAHEVLHVLRTMGKISPAEIKALAEFARNEGLFSPAREATYRKELARRGNAADVVSDILDEEAAAHAVEYRANLGRRLVEPPQVKTVLDRLAEFFAAIRDALKRKGFVAEGDAAPRTAATDVLEAFMSGEMIKRHGELAWMRSFMQAEDLTAVAVRNAAPQQVPRLSRPQQAPRLSRVTTPDGTATYDVEFEVVNLSDLKAATGDLQPRDRSTRAASTAQVQSMASKLNPELLIYSAQSDRGAPIIDENGVVLSGNGRVAAIRAARDMGASAYRDYVNRLASEGFDTSGAQQPVLVRRVKGLDNAGKREFAVKSNQDDKLAMAPAELARVDQDLMTDDVMMLLDADGDAGIAAAANRPFVRAVMGKLSPAQRGGLVGESGELTPAGVARLEAAIFARAYDDRALVNKIVEDQDGAGLRNALLGAAPAWAQMRAAAPKQFDVTKHLVEAVQTVVRMREQKIKPAEFFAQRDAFTQISPVTEGLVRSFYNEAGTRAAAWRTTRDLLKAYARIAAGQANAVGDLMGAAPTPREIVEGQLRSRADEQTAMFAIAREQTNDGLTASEKKAKAERLGYDTGTVWYHGTRADFEAFNPKAVVDARAEKYGFYKNYPRMVFLADNADLPYSFAGGEGGRIMPLYIKKNLRLFDAAADADKLSGLLAERGKEINDLLTSPVGDLMSALERGSWQVMEAKPVQDWLRANGYDGFKAKTDFIAGKTTTIAGILDTSADGNIRSTNARFEPEQASSPNLMFAFADDKPVTPGLDMSHEARMKRAKEMGFDTDNVLFHGTSGDDFEKFTARHQTGGMGLPGVYMTPDANYAATYSGTADGSRIMPLFVRGKIASPAEYQAIWDSVYDNTGGRFSGPALTSLVQDEMLRRGYTGKSSLYENEWPVVVVFDPRNIRSVNAAFDPANADSPNLMFAFAGERAKTADLNALNLAKRMELDGIDRDDIWVKTGWGRGVDGKWRFEIDDSDAQFFGPRGKNLGEWFYTPAYAAYPDLEQIKTPRFEAMMAGRGENAVYRRSLGPIREAMGFGREVEDDAGIHEVQHAIAAREDFDAGGTGFDIMLGRYDRLAGEVEARTVQKRMDMTAAERRARPMWHDYDVPEEQQIVRFGDGVQNSEPLFAIRHDDPPAMPQPKPSEGPFKTLLDQARDALARVEEVRQAAGDGGASLVRDATGLAQQIVKAGRRMSVVRDDDGRVTGLSPVSDEIQDAIAQAAEAIAPLVEAARKAGLSDIATALPQYADQLRNAAPDDLVRLAAEVMQTTDIDAIARALDDAVMQRSQPMFAFRRDDGTQKPGGKTRAQMLQEDLAAIEAQFANASGDERKKLHAERAVLLNAEKLEERLDDLDRYRDHWNRRDTPMAAMFSVENTGQAPFHDLSSWRDEIMGRVERMISGPIWGWRKGAVTGDLRRTLNSGVKLNMHNFVREAAGESTKDQLAKEFAKSWLAATEYLRQRFNAAGGDIAKLTGWFMPQWHDADALIKAGREQWVEFILPLLDRKRIVDHDTGVPMTDSALRTMLKEIWRTITSDGYNSLEIGDHMGRGALYKRHMEHRVLHFKNADSWLKYNNEYGGGDVYAAMISYISSMSRDIALMERFGANPELTWHRLKQFVIQEAKLAGPAKSLFDEFSGKIEELRAERKSLPSRIDELRDDLNTTLTTIDRLREEGKKSIRKENRNRGKISELSRDLPAKVKAIEDVLRSGDVQTPKQIELTNRIADLMVEMTEAGAYSVTSRNPVERAERLLQRADEMWKAFAGTTNTPISSTVAGVMSGARNWIGATTLVFAPFSAVTDQATQLAARSFIGMPATRQLASFVSGFTKGSREWALAQGFALDQAQAAFASQNRFVGWTNTRHLTGYIADRSHAFSLLSPMTQATKIGWYLDFTRWMGTLKDKEVIELPDDVQRLFDRHDISGSDWDAIRSAQLEDVKGMPGLTPLMVDKAVGEDLASKYVRMIVRERKQAVVEPTLRGRTAFVSETRPGTPAGELLRSVAMLKSFPTSYMLLIMGRLYHEIMAGRGLKPSTISYGAAVFIVGTLMGAMAKQLKAIGQGRDPEDMTQAKFWAAAFMQSGGVGIFGDFIGSSINRFGGGLAQTIAGPVADRATTLLDLTAGNLAQYANDEKTNAGRELTKFLRQNTPGMLAPWYVRTAYERLIVDKLQELVDPDVHRSYRQRVLTNRKVRPGNEFYWPPGSASRPRMPDLGAAFGAR